MRHTQIVATIGPASETPAVLPKLLAAGVNVARLNFSHGDYDEFDRIVRDIRRWDRGQARRRKSHRQTVILQDLSGPKLRVGEIPEGTRYRTGDTVTVTTEKVAGDGKRIPVNYAGLARDVQKGDTILIADGAIELKVTVTGATGLKSKVIECGPLRSHQGLNVPGRTLRIPVFTAKDKRDLGWGLAHGVDWVGMSFVTGPEDIKRLRRLIATVKPKKVPKIVAKVEKHEAVGRLQDIIGVADAVMVARGDLGVEIDPAEVPFVQKEIIHYANAVAKPVVTATQMLGSMTLNPRATRAEVSDIANAVLDGSDAVMLSEETAVGQYPVEAVRTMAHVIDDTERLFHRHRERLGLG